MSVCTFNSLPNEEYSNLFIIATFFNKSFPVRNSYLLTFPNDKEEIYLNHIELCFALFCY